MRGEKRVLEGKKKKRKRKKKMILSSAGRKKKAFIKDNFYDRGRKPKGRKASVEDKWVDLW